MEHGTTLEPSAIPVKLEHNKYISQVPHTLKMPWSYMYSFEETFKYILNSTRCNSMK